MAVVTKFGDWPSNGATPANEAMFQLSLNNTIIGSGESFFSIGTYTMPFTGNLNCELYLECNWPGDHSPGNWLSVHASPQRDGTSDLGVCIPGLEPYFGGAQEMRTHAWWGSLGVGTVVTAWARIYCTESGVVTCAWAGGFWRAAPL